MSLASFRWPFWELDLAAAGLAIVLTGLAYVAGVHPLVRHRQEAAAIRDRLTEAEQTARQLDISKRRVERTLEKQRRALPTDAVKLRAAAHLNQQLNALIGLARDRGLDIDEVHVGDSIEDEHYRKIMVVLRGTGTYQTWTEFLRSLHEQFRDVAVKGFELAASVRWPASEVTGSVDLVWYASSMQTGTPPAQ